MACRYVSGEDDSPRLVDVYSTPKTEKVAKGETELELHRAVFHGDLDGAKDALERGADVSIQDKYGNTPLHIAVMLGHKELVECLLSHGAMVKEKNKCGWTPLDESISYGDQQTIKLLLRKLREQTTQGLIQRRQKLISTLQNLEDFYAELKWEFHTWVPLLSRLLPSDICRIYKTGSCIRLDSTLGDFTGMQWSRGNVSFIFNGEESRTDTLSMVVLDNDSKTYQRMKLMGAEQMDMDLNEHVKFLMSKPVVYANMSTQPIAVSRAQSGWFFKADKKERVGEYETDVYNITNLHLNIRKRREHLTPEQIHEQEKMAKKVADGEIEEKDLMDDESDLVSVSLPPPPPCTLTWEQYINSSEEEPPHLGRQRDLKVEQKHYKASVCVTEACPIEMRKLLDILEVIAPYKHFHKLRQFCHMKLPPGFPVKLDIPVFPTVTAVITLEKYEESISATNKFLVPRDYHKVVPRMKEYTAATTVTHATEDPNSK